MGGTHVMMRVKLIHMFLDFFEGMSEVPVTYPVRDALKKDHYHIILNDETTKKDVPYEEFDYHIIKEDIKDKNGNYNVFANHLVNEIWPFLRNLWRARGGYRANIKFNPEIDLKEFGQQYGPAMFNAEYNFEISDEGIWEADFNVKFEQIDNPYDDRETPENGGRKGAFYAQDYSRIQANTAKRARKLAKAEWDVNEGRSGQDFTDLLREEEELNATIDFSFEHHYKGTGDWSETEQYIVTLAEKAERRDNTKDLDLPEKAEMEQAITLDSIIKKKPQQGKPKLVSTFDAKLLP
tara:strand:+ start:17 stop:898 length:882 start_codon:yes stop_codon:yes gene_type:complete